LRQVHSRRFYGVVKSSKRRCALRAVRVASDRRKCDCDVRWISRVRRALATLRGSKIHWRGPHRAAVVIIDHHRSDDLLPYLPSGDVVVLDVNGESLYVRPFIRTVLRGNLQMLGYALECIRLIRPSLVVTAIDTTTSFYRIKSEFPEITTVAVQNGKRAYEFFSELESSSSAGLSADHILCFGEIDRSIYGPFIRAQISPIGSVRNNRVPLGIHSSSRVVSLISTLRSKVDLDLRVPGYEAPNDVTYREIFSRRLRLAEYVRDFCVQSDLELVVIGKDVGSRAEEALYESVLGPEGSNWHFAERTDELASYRAIDRSRIVVTTSSTLGYEALARGIRTAFFMLDPEVTSNFGERFAWPEDVPDDGAIWANRLDRAKSLQVLEYLHLLDDEAWQQYRSDFVPRLIDFDPDNSRLRRVLTNALRRVAPGAEGSQLSP